ncbi:hypothetical protein [Tissierella sp.]|uniref:hypothetical protein n=1 Tax=Tissierella sp. TaxID=41274 RepID=UPI0028562DCB|nr:hypothetical protein [Tissierella sp.]MDR7856352.1 hypothetical protein [Tissierella sp.]
MKIENHLLNNLLLNNKDLLLKEGSILKGKILTFLDQIAIIEVKGHGSIQARVETDLKMNTNDEISFLVKSIKDSVINLKPINEDDSLQIDFKENRSISKLLQSINIKETKLSIGLVENLMKYNDSITEQKLNEGIKILEKLLQLINIKDEEKVVLVSPNTKNIGYSENNPQINNESNSQIEAKRPLTIELNRVNTYIPIEKEDIKYMLVANKNDYQNMKEISSIVKEFLGDEINTSINTEKMTSDNENVNNEIIFNKEEEFLKLTSFLIKNNIKPSLNNVKNLRELNNNPVDFANDFKKVNTIINRIENMQPDRALLNIEDKDILNDYMPLRDNELEELQVLLRNLSNNANLQQKDELKSLENKIDFLRELNSDLSLVFLPIHHRKENLDGILTFLEDKRKKKGSNENINIFINLNTNNLGKVSISCQLLGDLINAKISIKREDLELFQSAEDLLVEKISSLGYVLNKIDFVTDSIVQILDTMISNPNPTYILDLKV